MTWTRTQFVGTVVTGTPVTSLSVPLPTPVLANDLIVVGIGAVPPCDVYGVTDDLAVGSNGYSRAEQTTTPDIAGGVALFYALSSASQSSLAVAVDTGGEPAVLFSITVGVYRGYMPIYDENGDSGNGTAFALRGPPYTSFGPSMLVGMVGLVRNGPTPLAAQSPLTAAYFTPIGSAFQFVYADQLDATGSIRPTMTITAPRRFAWAWETWSSTLAPPSNPPSSFFSGGTQPAPVYYKQEGGPIISRPLRRRLRSEGFHV